MVMNIKMIALMGCLAATACAADVYSSFEDAQGDRIGSVDYDTANESCFQITGTAQIVFTQSGKVTGHADGPYCLTGYSDNACTVFVEQRVFRNVDLTTDGPTPYKISEALGAAGNYKWAPRDC